jgi:cellulose biosynthesis protein BcsQ
MANGNPVLAEGLVVRGRHIPVVAFYSAQGGVGKSTLAREFAELVTVAPGRDGHRPNVLLVDLDVGAQGLTIRLTQGMHVGTKTVHEIIAEQNPAGAAAVDVTRAVHLAGGVPRDRGQLYLIPAAPPDANALFDTCARTERVRLLSLLKDMIYTVAVQYDISCVVIDCPPGADPYSAAGATLADVPLLIGRNEQTTYDHIPIIPNRFREMYPAFQPARQRVIINAVTVRELYEMRKDKYMILDYIPMVSDVIHETEGLSRPESFQMLLFGKYVVDIIRQVLVGENHLIPETPALVGEEWVEAIQKLDRCEEAPRVRRLRRFGVARWVGLAVLLAGIAMLVVDKVVNPTSDGYFLASIALIVVGLVVVAVGLYAAGERHRVVATARDFVIGGPDYVLRMLNEGKASRRQMDQMKKLADSVPSRKR